MDRTNTPKKVSKTQIVAQKATLYEGPIPEPAILDAFNKIIPNGADRIMSMAEKDQEYKTAIHMEVIAVRDKASKREHTEIITGQICAFLLGTIALVGGIYLMIQGIYIYGGLLSVVPLISLLQTFITRKK